MKKVTLILASIAMMIFVSCKQETEETTEKTIIVEKEVEATPVDVEEVQDGTSVSINENGVEFSTKNGEKKTEVEIKEDGGSVSTKK
jgi:ABC-type enterochelin transport system substrate-binding protein